MKNPLAVLEPFQHTSVTGGLGFGVSKDNGDFAVAVLFDGNRVGGVL